VSLRKLDSRSGCTIETVSYSEVLVLVRLRFLLVALGLLIVGAGNCYAKQTTDSFEKIMEQARLYKRTRQNPQAFEAYTKALKLRPNNSEAHASLGWVLFELKMVDEAIEEENTALKLNPRNALAHHHLAIINMALGRYPEAADEYRAEYAIDPSRNCNCGPAYALMLHYPPGYTDLMNIRAKAEYDRAHPATKKVVKPVKPPAKGSK
jgi:tetratricopeptide (TPR) repeat protein